MITVFTPTYNRAKTLPKLYESLLKQQNKNFEWVIVDDGSYDNTEEIVEKWINDNQIKIIYHKKQNGGKHRAINKGIELANGKLFFIVDSDDYLPRTSLEIIFGKSEKLNGNIVGLAGRRQYPNGEIIGDSFPQKEFVSDHIEKTYVKGINGDLAEVVKTDVLKRFCFPDFKDEKFCAEGLLWNRLSKEFKILFFEKPIYICEYLEGGLSENSIRNRRKSPTYAMQLYSELSQDNRLALKMKIRTYINFWRFSFFSPLSIMEKWKMINNSMLGLVCFPFGWALKIKDGRNDIVKINN